MAEEMAGEEVVVGAMTVEEVAMERQQWWRQRRGLCWVVCGGGDGTTGDHGRAGSKERDADDRDGGRT